MPRIAAKTLGCKVNQYDTEAMLELFEAAGYESVAFENEADVYLINTCTVTGTGDTKSLKLIRRVRREHPNAGIIAAGCLSQRDPDVVKAAGASMAIGIKRRREVVSLYEQAMQSGSFLDATGDIKRAEFEKLTVSRHEGKTRAVMKIQEGCDRFCSYCVIPYVRGPVRSMPLNDVRDEAQRLSKEGYREIVLTGIHLASYGRDTGETLIDAIKAISAFVPRIRLGSLEPITAGDEFAKELSKINGVCDQFHLSLQSGSDSVLKRMNRRYSANEYLEACENLRRYFPNCAITTDVIVGFPGETEAEFEQTCEFVQAARLSKLHVFPYSRRSGTLADKLPNQVSEEVKKIRSEKLIKIGNQLESAYVKALEGTCQSVLFETELEDGMCTGHATSYVKVVANADAGEIAKVLITHTEGTTCYGNIMK